MTAIVVANDQMALGVLSALAQLNRTGSRAVSVTGYDDTAKAASFQISHTGTYTIVGKEDTASLTHAADTEHSWSPIFFLIPACLLLLSAGVFFLRRRRK